MSATSTPAPILAPESIAERPASLWRDTLGNVFRQKSAIVGAIIMAVLVLMAVFAPLIATHDPTQVLLGVEDGITKRAAPCIHVLGCAASEPEHYFGTDGNFRDVFSRVVFGARTSLVVGLIAVSFAITVGTIIGAVAGYYPRADNPLMRIMDVLLSFPSLLLAILIVTALGPGLVNALLAIGIVTTPIYARIVRSSVLSTRENDYVTASRALGESSRGILFRRILPNSLTPLVVAGTLGIGTAVLEIAALAFVGVTGDLTVPEWGSMIAIERNQLFQAPHIILAPGVAITLTVLGFNLLGDGLRDALDPRLEPMTADATSPTIEEIRPIGNRRARSSGDGPLLEVRGLATSFHTRDGAVRAVDGIDFQVGRGEIMGLVGESGCGKSVTSLSIMRLVAEPGRIERGQILFDGRDLLTLSNTEMRELRGDRISMIFQQPQSSLNPVWNVERQISEVLEIHRNMKAKAARSRALELLQMVGIPDPQRRLASFPHELSGGMAQRVMIAMALACEPELLIADEPTTALDVTIQAQILDLMRNLRDETGTAIILITHDLGVVAEMCDRVAVMYAGEIVEQTDVESLFSNPLHPYARGLIASIPVVGNVRDELAVIPGNVPNLIDLPVGCRFAPRCLSRIEENVVLADSAHPALLETAPGHTVRCWLYHDESGAPITRPETNPHV